MSTDVEVLNEKVTFPLFRRYRHSLDIIRHIIDIDVEGFVLAFPKDRAVTDDIGCARQREPNPKRVIRAMIASSGPDGNIL